MKTITQQIRDHLLGNKPALEELRQTEWSGLFEQLMRNRLLMGSFRYGRLRAEGKPRYNHVEDIYRRLDAYEQTGNLELLADVANLALCEFVAGWHPLRHFHSADDGEHTEVK